MTVIKIIPRKWLDCEGFKLSPLPQIELYSYYSKKYSEEATSNTYAIILSFLVWSLEIWIGHKSDIPK